VIAPSVECVQRKVGYGGRNFEVGRSVARGKRSQILRVHVCRPLGAEKMQCECHKGDKGKEQMA